MDNYYSGSDAVLIGSLCGGIGAVLLGIGIGICIVCYAKRKASREASEYSRGTDRFWGTENPPRYRRRESPPAPYVPRETGRTAVRYPAPYAPRNSVRAALRYPGSTAPNQVPRRPISAGEPAQRVPRPEPSPDREPPCYNSIWEPSGGTNDTSSSITAPQSGASFSPEIQEQPSVSVSDTEESYQPPPPEYVMTIEYPELYKVTEREPAFV